MGGGCLWWKVGSGCAALYTGRGGGATRRRDERGIESLRVNAIYSRIRPAEEIDFEIRPTWEAQVDLKEALRHALDGNAVLFLGAGFSDGAQNKLGAGFPMAGELSKLLMQSLGESEDLPLSTASEYYKKIKGRVGLLQFLEDHLNATTVTEQHKSFCRVKWRRIYSTNYDDVFEKACDEAGVRVESFALSSSVNDINIPDGKLQCVHLNGYLPTCNVANVDDQLTLSDTSYATGKFLGSPWRPILIDDFRSAKAIIFVGYSLSDLDVKRVLVAQAVRSKTVFVTKPNPSLVLR